MHTGKRPRIVIVGAGFGGLWAVRALARARADVVLADRNNYHTFLPLLYQVAASELAPGDIVFPLRTILRGIPNAEFCLGEIEQIDFSAKTIRSGSRSLPYDYLILATGSVTHFFGVPGASEYACALKSVEEGIALRNRILTCFEQAFQESDERRRRALLTFAVVGGGPTGVEFAGALSELARGPLTRDFRRLDPRDVRIVLLEASTRLLSAMPERLARYARARLERMGVEVRLAALVSEVRQDAVCLKDGTVIQTETVVWTAGVRGDPKAHFWGLPTARAGRVGVLPTLQLAGYPEVYVIGDLAEAADRGQMLPQIAPVATQQGTAAARNIMRQMRGEPTRPFHYRDWGMMATIGRNAAVASLLGRSFSGFPAWVIWLTVHLAKLIGFRNRLLVLINWAWDYLFFERAVRLIMPSIRENRMHRIDVS